LVVLGFGVRAYLALRLQVPGFCFFVGEWGRGLGGGGMGCLGSGVAFEIRGLRSI
jgi:hypothetical protein